MKTFFYLLLIVIVLISTAMESNAQCAMCKASVEKSQSERAPLEQRARGLNTGILYLMCVPYILGGIIGYYWYRNSKKERDRKIEIQRIIRSKMSSM